MDLPDRSTLRAGDRHLAIGLSDDDIVSMYRVMLRTRLLDGRIRRLEEQGRAAFVVTSQGHEATQVASASTLRAGQDWAVPYYRDLGVVLTLGLSVEEVLLGVLARAADPSSGGRQMPGHWGSRARRIMSGSSSVGSQVPHAAGLAMGADNDGVAMCWFGESAMARGDVHEALNIAGIHRLPVVFVCEHNGWATSVPASTQLALDDVAGRAAAYDVAASVVDGNDALDVFAAVREAVGRARRGDGPTLVECKVWRWLPRRDGEAASADAEAWRRRDPIARLRAYLGAQRLLSDDDDHALARELATEIEEALTRAEASPPPSPSTATTHVFAPSEPRRSSDPSGHSISTVRFGEAVAGAHAALMGEDQRVTVLGSDVGTRGGLFGATAGLLERFGPTRVIEMPIGVAGLIGTGVGLAVAGRRPVVEVQFADFIGAGFEQLAGEAARLRYRTNGDIECPLVVRAPWGGGVHGGLYHSQAVEALFAHVPGLKVVVPATASDAAGLLRAAVLDPDPVLVLEHKALYRLAEGEVPDGAITPIGEAEVARPGGDVTIVTYGLHRHLALESAEVLWAEHDVDTEVIDLRTISPLDVDALLASARKTGRVLVVHEDAVSFGVGAEVAAVVTERAWGDLDAPVRRLAMPDVPAFPFAPSLEQALTIKASEITESVLELFES